MSILGNLFSRILGHKASAAAASPPPSATAPAKPTAAPPGASAVPPVPNTGGAPASAAPRVARMDDVELEPLLDALVKTNGQKLDWRHSIVDLMKAVGMESSLAERKELAKELRIHRGHGRLREDEPMAASRSAQSDRRQRRQGAGGSEGLTGKEDVPALLASATKRAAPRRGVSSSRPRRRGGEAPRNLQGSERRTTHGRGMRGRGCIAALGVPGTARDRY